MFKRILPHICIDVSVIFIVLWIIDRYNGAMHMLSRDIFKIPFFIFLLLVIAESVLVIIRQRKELPDEEPAESNSIRKERNAVQALSAGLRKVKGWFSATQNRGKKRAAGPETAGVETKNRKPGLLGKTSEIVVRVLALVLTFLFSLVIILFGIIWVFEKGPSESLTSAFCRSVRETSAIRWLSNIYLSDEELEKYITEKTEDLETDLVDTSFIHLDEKSDDGEPAVQLIDIAMGTAKGKLLIVKDPKSVRLGTSDDFGKKPGLQLTELVAKYGGLAGINAGGFNDESGQGDGGRPQGLVIEDGVITWGNPNTRYNVIGIDYDGILHVETITGNTAIEEGIRWGVSFVTHDGQASALIINGEIQMQNMGSGVNPRTAIGQRQDGALLLLVLDGRSINTLGATMEDICNVMLEYGAWNVGNLDGGSSSVMVYDGEIINHCASVTGPRRIPTAFIVLDGGSENG